MKNLKKIVALFICATMLFGMCGIVAFATSGELRFSDPETTVGAEVEVTAKMTADYPLGNVEATLSYDSETLRFISGENVTKDGSTLKITGNANGAQEMNWSMKFQALSEGTTTITVSSVSATDTDGDAASIVQGSSAVTIGPGDPSLIQPEEGEETTTGGSGTVEIDGITYTVVTDIPEVLMPEGFVSGDLEYNDSVFAALVSEANENIYAVYLQNPEEETDFFLYDAETKAFAPFEQVKVAEERYIVLLSEDRTEELPENLQSTTMALNGKEFPAWQNVDASAYYVLYAMNSDGDKAYYQYDTVDGTYQRYIPETPELEEVERGKLGTFIDKLRENLDKVIMVAWGIFLFMLLIIIIMSIKLRHRNLELDDLYEEYGIDDEEPVKETRADKKAKKKADKAAKKEAKKDAKKAKKGKKVDQNLYDFDDSDEEFDDSEEPEYDEAEYEEEDLDEAEYDEAEFEEESEEEDLFSEYNASDFEDDSDIDDLDAMLNARVQKREKQRPMYTIEKTQDPRLGHSDPDDTFKMDLIDLD